MPTSSLLQQPSRKSGTVSEKSECSVFLSKYYFRQYFLTSYWIGFYFVTSLRVCSTPSDSPLLDIFLTPSSLLSQSQSDSTEVSEHCREFNLKLVSRVSSELYCEVEREKARLGLRAGAVSGGRGGNPAESLITPR